MVSTMSFKEVFKNNSDLSAAISNKQNLFKEINSGMREPLNREEFKKSPEEKEKIYSLKSKWKSLMRECFPDPKVRKTYNNPICK